MLDCRAWWSDQCIEKRTYIWKVQVRIQNLGKPLRWAFRENSQRKTVNWKLFTIFAKSCILDVWVRFEYPSEVVKKKSIILVLWPFSINTRNIAIKSTIWYEALYRVLLVILSANESATWKPLCIYENGS